MLYNKSKTDVLLLPGCPQLTIHHTSPGTASTTSDERAAELLEVLSLDVRSNQYLIQTLCHQGHQDCSALSNSNDRVERGDGTTLLDVTCNQDYLYLLRREPGWLARPKGKKVYKELCKRIEVPTPETPIVFLARCLFCYVGARSRMITLLSMLIMLSIFSMISNIS